MSFPSDADLNFVRQAQAELSKPVTRALLEFAHREASKPLFQLEEITKRASTFPVGTNITTHVGLGPNRYASSLLDQTGVLQQVMGATFRPEVRISALNSITYSDVPRIINSKITRNLDASTRAANWYDKAASDLMAASLPNLRVAAAAMTLSEQAVGILGQTRSALGSFDRAAYGVQAQLRTNVDVAAKISALNMGLTTSNLLSAQIELAATRLTRTGIRRWSDLPTGSVLGLARLSSLTPFSAAYPSDLMSVARGVYGLTSFAARAAEMDALSESVKAEPDDTVEEWSESTLAHDLRAALSDLHPALAAKLEGAWEVYRRRGPDALGQAATSLVELIDRSMDLLAPAEEVTRFATENHLVGPHYFTDKGNPTVALKVRFVLRARPLTAEAVDAQVSALTKARKSLQASKHSLDFSDDLLIGRLLLTVENVFTVILFSEG